MASLSFTEGHAGPPSPIRGARQLFPNIVDGLAVSRSDSLYAQIPRSYTSYDEGFREVTYLQLANAINGVAWLLTEELGPGKDNETLAYIGPNDIGYIAVTLGACKAGYVMLSPSPRLNEADHASLMSATKCKTVLTLPPPYGPTVQPLLDCTTPRPRIVHVPTIYALLDTPSRHFPYPYTYEQIKDQPLVIVHSSGTTGAPKPIVYTHAAASAHSLSLHVPAPKGYYRATSIAEGNRLLAALPFFHCAAVCVSLIHAIINETTMVTMLGGAPLTTESFIRAMELTSVDAACLASPFVEQIVKHEPWFELVTSRVKRLAFAGADLSDAAGRALGGAGVRLCNCYGSTECMMLPPIVPLAGRSPEDCLWLELNPHNNAAFEPRGELFEMVLRRNPDPERRQPAFVVSPHLEEYRTGDLFRPHPADPKLWRYEGRADDLIVAATGEVCNPSAFEKELSALPGVGEAVMVGAGRWQKALLIEPTEPGLSPARAAELVDGIWPLVEKANKKLSKTSQVARTHVLITAPDLPMPRTSKGNVMRALTLRLYKDRFDELYRLQGDGSDAQVAPVPIHLPMHQQGIATIIG